MVDTFTQMKSNPGAIVNIDTANYHGYWKNRKAEEETKNKLDEINNLKAQMDDIAKEQQQIKELLIKLLEKN